MTRFLLLAMSMSSFSAGCSEEGPPVAPAAGVVTYRGQPVKHAKVVFIPQDVPNGKVVGLSKLARVVEVVSHRPQVQERMTEEIANLLISELDVKGVAVVIEASHSCMGIRGIRKPESLCVTSAMKGIFRSNLSSRAEVMNLIYGDRR